jgi:hypothetical protein
MPIFDFRLISSAAPIGKQKSAIGNQSAQTAA